VICGDPVTTTAPSGRKGAMLRGYDKTTGAEVGAVYMPAAQIGAPMSYMLGGTQYIVVPTGGGSSEGAFIAFRAPRAS
jgi:quinoprotein glucose dehydrogenase